MELILETVTSVLRDMKDEITQNRLNKTRDRSRINSEIHFSMQNSS